MLQNDDWFLCDKYKEPIRCSTLIQAIILNWANLILYLLTISLCLLVPVILASPFTIAYFMKLLNL